jgi:hypothetical protein
MAIRQAGAVTGSRRLRKKNQILDLEARLAAFPATLAARNQRQQQEATAKHRADTLALEQKSQKQQHKQAKQTLGFEREQSRKAMGLEAAKLGGSVLSSDMGFNIGKSNKTPYIPMTGMKDSGSAFSGLNIGGGVQGAVGGAGIGFGLANMFGKGKKGTKWLGAGLGALAGGAIGSGLMSNMLFSGWGS